MRTDAFFYNTANLSPFKVISYFFPFTVLNLSDLVSVSYVTGDSGFGMDDSFLQLSLFPGDGNLKNFLWRRFRLLSRLPMHPAKREEVG